MWIMAGYELAAPGLLATSKNWSYAVDLVASEDG